MKIQILGPVCGTGYGLTVAHLVEELVKLGEQIQLLPIGDMDFKSLPTGAAVACDEAHKRQLAAEGLPDVTLCVWHEWDHPPRDYARVKHWLSKNYVAMPTFELDRVRPEAVPALAECRNVLVSSAWNKMVLERHGLTNVTQLVHHGVDPYVFYPRNLEAITKPSGPFRMFNMGKLELRKGHDLCIDLVAAMLQLGLDVQLWAMWDNPFMERGSMQQLLDKWAQRSARQFHVDVKDIYTRVLMVPSRPKAEDVAKVINSTVFGVYPFRAEGWNLPLLETMACARPVVASWYTAPADYLDFENCRLIQKCESVIAEDGIWFGENRAQGRWFEPNFAELLQLTLEAYNLWKTGRLEPNMAGRRTAENFSWMAAALRLSSWLRSEFVSSS